MFHVHHAACWALAVLAVRAAPVFAGAGGECQSLEEVERLLAPSGGGVRLTDVVAVAPDDIWAVGYSWTADERCTLTVHYDGTSWTVAPSPSPGGAGLVSAGLNAVAAVASDDVWAAGDYERDGGPYRDTLVLHWDGSDWEMVPSPGVSDFGEQGFTFEAVEAVGPDDIWFTGTRGNRALGAFTAHWDGSDFTVHATPSVVNRAHEMVGMSMLSPTDVWGVGGTATGLRGGFVMRWNGSQWSTFLAPDLGGPQRYFYDVASFAADDVWVAGIEYFIDDDYVYRPRPYFIHWDGSTWTEVATPDFVVKLKAFAPADIYGISGQTLVHWDGATWSLVGSLAEAGTLNNLTSLDGFDGCTLQMVGQVDTGVPGELAGWIVRTVGHVPGDFDGDGDVDLDDHAAFRDCMMGPGGDMLPGCDETDLDVDSDTDEADFAMFQTVFGG